MIRVIETHDGAYFDTHVFENIELAQKFLSEQMHELEINYCVDFKIEGGNIIHIKAFYGLHNVTLELKENNEND